MISHQMRMLIARGFASPLMTDKSRLTRDDTPSHVGRQSGGRCGHFGSGKPLTVLTAERRKDAQVFYEKIGVQETGKRFAKELNVERNAQ